MSPSAKVVVVATVQVQAGTEEQAEKAFTTAIAATHEEEGCLGYALHRDLDDPTRYVIVEQWASQEALSAHGSEPHLKALFAELGPIISGAPSIIRTEAVPVGDGAKGAL